MLLTVSERMRRRGRWSLVVGVLAVASMLVGLASAATWTDKEDYAPGETVTISGDNSDGAGYLAGETVRVDVSGPNGWTATCEAVVDDAGPWSCQVTLVDGVEAVGDYEYTATGLQSGVTESGTFRDGTPFLRAAITGGTRVGATFAAGAVTEHANLTCAPAATKTSVLGFTTPLTGAGTNLGNGNFGAVSTAAGVSVRLVAPATVTHNLVTYAFSSFSLVNDFGLTPHGSVTTNGLVGCYVPANSNGVIIQANYVLAQGTLVVNKSFLNAAGKVGNKTAADFLFDVAGPTASSNVAFEADGSNSLTVNAGDYTVTEDAENGYTASYNNCTSVAVTGGGTTTCTITNTFNGYASSTSSTVSSSSFTIGGSVTDTAEVTGDADGGDPGGSVKFYLCGPAAPEAAYPDCSTGGTLVATDTTATDAGTDKSSFSSGSYTPSAAGKYCFRAEYQGSSLYVGSADYDSSECFLVNPASATVVYTGQFADADGPPTTLSATVTSSYQACAANRQVKFELDGSTTDYLGANAKTATTGATTTGSYTGSASTSQTLAYDVYDLEASVAAKDLGSDGIPECAGDSDPADLILTVAEPGASAHGGGWYKHNTATPPRINLGFSVKKQKDGSYKGQMLWTNNSRWKLKGTIDGYGTFTVGCPTTVERCGVVTGTGTLYEWNGTEWVNPQTVSFSATFYDGGETSCAKKNCQKQERPDYFGMQIHLRSIAPESDPIQLSGGSIKAGAAA